jgi:hypothetical protein
MIAMPGSAEMNVFGALNIVRFFLDYGLILFRVAYLAEVPMVSIR